MIQLRPYQKDIINKVRYSFSKNKKRILTVLPCGGGKTVCFAYMAEKHILKNPTKNKVWFLVHRQELIDQTLDTFKRFNINMNNIFIGMVQTVSRRIELYNEKPTLIIFDEAHHSTANTWLKIINAFPDIPVVGLTATPCRLNGDNLGSIYEELIVGVNSDYLLQNGYLSQYDYYAPNINIMLPKIKGSDFDNAEVEFKSVIYGDVIKYIDLERKTIIYCPNVEFSKSLQELINFHFGNIAVHFDGGTDKQLRKQIIEDFRNDKIKILLNVDLIGEGFDVPDCDCVMLLRPTMSTALYIQQSMRCLRPKPNKRAVIYDFVGNVHRHGMPTDDREWSLINKVKCRNSSGVPEVLTRMCSECYRVYAGKDSICPYCGHNNGKTKAQIEQEEKAELERIEKVEKKKKRMQVGMAHDLASLIKIGRERGYKNPEYWAKTVLQYRKSKI